eukprot:INCI3081.1.p2 GENE.INCI3081.1~~INCI3081.1.p2  ORF type:complete len:135 (+),score=13.95 INCI3081.1:74-478(+)
MWLLCPRYPFIEAPLFVAENRFDQNQIGDVLGVDWWPLRNATRAEQYKEYYGKLMLDAMQQVIESPKNDGLFMPSCYDHTDNLCMKQGPSVQNATFADALWNWYSETDTHAIHLVDDCNAKLGVDGPCNSYCKC